MSEAIYDIEGQWQAVEAATVSIGISGHTYEVELRGHDKARHVHDVILHYAARAH